ncbi:MAG: ABC transporter ATP-binding protein [Candidatus Rokubacteria bacterium]|nr:ABC transporter ATP-binding protein [Candidatus Rokubacteria bacterium]
MADRVIISVRDLRVWFPVRRTFVDAVLRGGSGRFLRAVDGVSFDLRPGEILGLAGESGCGKSTLAMTLLGLNRPTAGRVEFLGEDLTTWIATKPDTFRRSAQLVFQDPYESLNPRFTVGQTVEEPLVIHGLDDATGRRRCAAETLELAGLTPARQFLPLYPHQLSGGQRQRIALARAVVLRPRFLVTDEPVSMLDVSVRAGILRLLKSFARDLGVAILYISHDLSTMRHISDRIAVMYLGRIVELAAADAIVSRPRHPYTQALMASVPIPDPARRRVPPRIDGSIPSPIGEFAGCAFASRCPHVMDVCRHTVPALRPVGAGHAAACHLHDVTPAEAGISKGETNDPVVQR